MIATGKNNLLKVGVNSDVITCWCRCYERYKNQPQALVQNLGDASIDDKCQAIFSYMCNKIRYKLDPDGKQYIKSPGRLLLDGCGDCKSLTMFVACCLHCLGIKCIVRFVNFDNGSQYTHVYPVAIDEYGDEIIMDMCETTGNSASMGTPLYGYARPYKRKKDIVYE